MFSRGVLSLVDANVGRLPPPTQNALWAELVWTLRASREMCVHTHCNHIFHTLPIWSFLFTAVNAATLSHAAQTKPHKAALQRSSGDMRDVLTAVMNSPAVRPMKAVCSQEESDGGICTMAAITGVEQPSSENPALSGVFSRKSDAPLLRSSSAQQMNVFFTLVTRPKYSWEDDTKQVQCGSSSRQSQDESRLHLKKSRASFSSAWMKTPDGCHSHVLQFVCLCFKNKVHFCPHMVVETLEPACSSDESLQINQH